jgi:YceI-like domain
MLPCFASSQDIYVSEKGVISFRSNATLELIKASSNKVRGVIDAQQKTFAFEVRINSFEGFNSDLQREHFNENYLESTKFVSAIFKGKIIEDIDFNINGKYMVRAKGALNIHGVEQERIIKCSIEINDHTIHLESDFMVLLNDHNIIVPKVVHEKVATAIEVAVQCDLKRKN